MFPNFVDIVLNHLSEKSDSLFWQILRCVSILLEMKGKCCTINRELTIPGDLWLQSQIYAPLEVIDMLMVQFVATTNPQTHSVLLAIFVSLLASLEKFEGNNN